MYLGEALAALKDWLMCNVPLWQHSILARLSLWLLRCFCNFPVSTCKLLQAFRKRIHSVEPWSAMCTMTAIVSFVRYHVSFWKSHWLLNKAWSRITMCCRLNAEWRGDKSADEVALGSKAKFLWACSDCGHEYEARPSARSSKLSGCPKCAKEACKDGPNRLGLLKDNRPDLVEEFDTEANPKCVSFLTCGSRFNASWICKLCGKSYQKKVWERVKLNLGCPSCTNQERIGNRPVSETRLVEESRNIGTVDLPESDQPKAVGEGVGTETHGKSMKSRDQKSQSMLQTQTDGRR